MTLDDETREALGFGDVWGATIEARGIYAHLVIAAAGERRRAWWRRRPKRKRDDEETKRAKARERLQRWREANRERSRELNREASKKYRRTHG